MEQQLRNLLSQIYREPSYSQPHGGNGADLNADDFRMYVYKILPCTRRGPHSWVECSYCHPGEKAARRCPQKFSYVPISCPSMKKDGQCPQGDDCIYAHNVFEYWLHPARYRTQLCSYGMECKRGICFFAHHPRDVRVHEHSAQLAALENQLMASEPSFAAPGPNFAAPRQQAERQHQQAGDAKFQQRHVQQPYPDPFQAEQLRLLQAIQQQQQGQAGVGNQNNRNPELSFNHYLPGQGMQLQQPPGHAAAAAAAMFEAALQPPTPPVGHPLAHHQSLSPSHSLSNPLSSLNHQPDDAMAAAMRLIAELSAAGKPPMQQSGFVGSPRLHSVSSMPPLMPQQHHMQQQQHGADGSSDMQQALQLIGQLQMLAGKASASPGGNNSLHSLLQNALPQLLLQVGGGNVPPQPSPAHMASFGTSGLGGGLLQPCASAPVQLLPIQAPRKSMSGNGSPESALKGTGQVVTSASPADALSVRSQHTAESYSSRLSDTSHSPPLSHHSDEGIRGHGHGGSSMFSSLRQPFRLSTLHEEVAKRTSAPGSVVGSVHDRDVEPQVDLAAGMSDMSGASAMIAALSELVEGSNTAAAASGQVPSINELDAQLRQLSVGQHGP